MSNNNKIPQFADVPKFLRQKISGITASEASEFFKNCFAKSSFTDNSLQAWKQTNYK
jgi:hypothetical protein